MQSPGVLCCASSGSKGDNAEREKGPLQTFYDIKLLNRKEEEEGIRIHLPLFIGAHFGTALNGKGREGERRITVDIGCSSTYLVWVT